MPGLWRHFLQLTDDAPTVVDLNFFITGLAVQHIFVIAFDTELTDIMRCRVVCQLAVFVEPLNVFIVNF